MPLGTHSAHTRAKKLWMPCPSLGPQASWWKLKSLRWICLQAETAWNSGDAPWFPLANTRTSILTLRLRAMQAFGTTRNGFARTSSPERAREQPWILHPICVRMTGSMDARSCRFSRELRFPGSTRRPECRQIHGFGMDCEPGSAMV